MKHRATLLNRHPIAGPPVSYQTEKHQINRHESRKRGTGKVRQETFFSHNEFAPIDQCPTSRQPSNV